MPASVLHVAALPFPSSQGTQAALLAIVRAAAEARDREVALLTYEAGDGRVVLPARVAHRRTRAPVANRSLRSGPSIAKLLEDVELVRLVRQAPEPDLVAHHVEAGLACVLARRPFTWVAHTALGPELPLYVPRARAIAPLLGRMGEAVDHEVARRARRVLAVSPVLAARIERHFGVPASVLPTPWPVAPRVSELERAHARRALGLEPEHEVVLYAGNLDHYQGLDTAVGALGALAHRRAALRWLVATESSRDDLVAMARRAGIAARVIACPLADDGARRRAHAAADVVIVPRRLEAGLSIKILEALAHALPTVAVRAATGGFPLERACSIVDDEPTALARAIGDVLDQPFLRMALAAAGPPHLAAHHDDASCVRALARA